MKGSALPLFSVNPMYSVNFMSVKVMLYCISLFAAILKNVFHPSNADFGSGYAGQPQQETSFVEFEIDEEDFERNGAANQRNPTASTFLPISLLTMLLAFKLA